jgi:hypothetical protein
MSQSTRLPLAGLDGSNPLAFLAALGTLRVLTRVWPERDVRLGWESRGGRWTPFLHFAHSAAPEDVVAALEPALRAMAGHRAFTFADDLKLSAARFAEFSSQATAAARNDGDPVAAEFAAAFACELLTDEDGNILDTAFRTMSGAGHQHFLRFMAELARLTTREQIEAALFSPWRYEEQKLSMRWDPADDRRYALRWDDPSGDVIRTVRGANRLAIEALPLFPVAPVGSDLETTGFSSLDGRGAFWTWPIWEPALPLDTVRTVLALEELQAARPNRRELAARGIAEVFRCERITIGKFRNFTPAQAV